MMMIMYGPADTHDRAAMGTTVDNIESMLKEKTMMHKYTEVLSVCIHSHVAMIIVFVFVHHGLLFQH